VKDMYLLEINLLRTWKIERSHQEKKGRRDNGLGDMGGLPSKRGNPETKGGQGKKNVGDQGEGKLKKRNAGEG